VSVRLSPLTIPRKIKSEFQQIEEERAKIRLQERQEEAILKDMKNKKVRAENEKLKEKEVASLTSERRVAEKKSNIAGEKIKCKFLFVVCFNSRIK